MFKIIFIRFIQSSITRNNDKLISTIIQLLFEKKKKKRGNLSVIFNFLNIFRNFIYFLMQKFQE